MTEKKSNDSRRKLLKSIAAGSGAVVAGKTLPDAWTKPVIDTVMLPAHAELTDGSDSSGTDTCCLKAECYGGSATSPPGDGAAPISSYIEISVETDGGIEVEVYMDCEHYSGSTKIACTGDQFTVTAEREQSNGVCAPQEDGAGDTAEAAPDTIEVTGTVNCEDTVITGMFKYGTTDYSYTAYAGKCES